MQHILDIITLVIASIAGLVIIYGVILGIIELIQVEAGNRRLNKAKETLKAQKVELEAKLKASQAAVINVPNLECFIKDMQDKLPNLDYEGKRLALDMLDVTVWLDGENVEVIGIIEPNLKPDIVPQSSRCSFNGNKFSFNLRNR